jgi:hypothetical protein
MIRTSCHAQARLLSTAAKCHHHQPEAAPLAPRGRWGLGTKPGASFVRGPGRACNFEDTQAPPAPEPPTESRPRVAQKTRTQLQVPHLDPRAPDSESRPGSRLAGVVSLLPVNVLTSESGPGPGPRSPAQSPRSGSAPGGSRFRLRSRPLLLLVTSGLGPKERPQESRSAPRGSVGLAGCAGAAGPERNPGWPRSRPNPSTLLGGIQSREPTVCGPCVGSGCRHAVIKRAASFSNSRL